MAAGAAGASSEATANVKTMAGPLAALPRQLLPAVFIQLCIMSPRWIGVKVVSKARQRCALCFGFDTSRPGKWCETGYFPYMESVPIQSKVRLLPVVNWVEMNE
jgi:hypothetical protein